MPIRRRYSITINDDLFVIDWPGGGGHTDISSYYTISGHRIGRTAVDLNVEAGTLRPEYFTNGVGGVIVGQHLIELAGLYTDDCKQTARAPRKLP